MKEEGELITANVASRPMAYGLGTSKTKKKKPYADYVSCPRPMAWARVTTQYDKIIDVLGGILKILPRLSSS